MQTFKSLQSCLIWQVDLLGQTSLHDYKTYTLDCWNSDLDFMLVKKLFKKLLTQILANIAPSYIRSTFMLLSDTLLDLIVKRNVSTVDITTQKQVRDYAIFSNITSFKEKGLYRVAGL